MFALFYVASSPTDEKLPLWKAKGRTTSPPAGRRTEAIETIERAVKLALGIQDWNPRTLAQAAAIPRSLH